jgi:hypothetical protein
MPIFLDGIMPPALMGGSAVGSVLEIAAFAVGGAIIYLYLFNRVTRQSFHDLIARTYVIDSATQGKVGVGPVWKGHLIVLAALLLVTLGVSKVVELRLERSRDFSVLFSIIEKLTNSRMVYSASAIEMAAMGTDGTNHYLVVSARWKGRPGNLQRATKEIASMVLDQDPNILGQQVLVVNVTYGFNIGIASAWRGYTARGTPAEWRTKFNQVNPAK